jgi:hypothetical protein
VELFAEKNPAVSNVGANGKHPDKGSCPCVGLNPTTPQNDAGRITDPCVCDPTAYGTIPQATAAADPDDDPPGVWLSRCGFLVGAESKYANDVVWVFPAISAPLSRSSLTSPESSCAGPASANNRDPCLVGIPATSKMSLIPIGIFVSVPAPETG